MKINATPFQVLEGKDVDLAQWATRSKPLCKSKKAYRKALEANGKTFEIFVYDGVNHAFNNDTSSARYDKAAADLAWSRTIEFLKKNLA